MNSPRAAAIYARISKDQTGESLGVARQIEDCRALAHELGWPVAEVYSDNDLSAFSGRIRPEYRRMLDDLRRGTRDAVIAWHSDRISRGRDLEEFIEVCRARGADVRTCRSGALDLNTSQGRMVARIHGAIARGESERMGERMRRGNRQHAEMGRPNTRGRRKFGYESDGVTLRADEAAVIQALATRFLAGESLAALVRWLNDERIPTATGATTWWPAGLRAMLRSGRISAQREYHGEIVAPGQWPAIITPDQTALIRRVLDDPGRKHVRTPSRYLLTGLLRCGLCDRPLIAHPKKHGPAYDCRRDGGLRGCGKISITAEPLEDYTRLAVLTALDSPELADAALKHADQHSDPENLADTIRTDEARRTELAAIFADGNIDREQLATGTKRLTERIERNRDRLAAQGDHRDLARYLGTGHHIARDWGKLNLDQRRHIVRTALSAITIGPAAPGARTFDPQRVTLTWRL